MSDNKTQPTKDIEEIMSEHHDPEKQAKKKLEKEREKRQKDKEADFGL